MLGNPAVGAADMDHDAVEIHDRPDRLERPAAPSGRLGIKVRRDFRDQRGGDLHVVQLVDNLLNIAGCHPLGIQRENLFIEARQASLVLADQLRLERAIAITGSGDRQLAQVALHRLARTAVAAVRGTFGRRRIRQIASRWRIGRRIVFHHSGGSFAAQVDIHLGVQHPLQRGLHHRSHQTVEILSRAGLAGDLVC